VVPVRIMNVPASIVNTLGYMIVCELLFTIDKIGLENGEIVISGLRPGPVDPQAGTIQVIGPDDTLVVHGDGIWLPEATKGQYVRYTVRLTTEITTVRQEE